MVVREDTAGRLVEKAALRFDLRNPLGIKPEDRDGRDDVRHPCRDAGAGRAGEHRLRGVPGPARVVEAVGLPDPSFFIFYDDVDFAMRARRAGFHIWAVRDAVLVRQLEFDQQLDLAGWKGYYMYRNLFTIHLRYGENALVRAKPWLITAAWSPSRPCAVAARRRATSAGRSGTRGCRCPLRPGALTR